MGNYEKLNLVNGTPFAAEHVAHMEDGIAAVEAQATAVAGDVAAVAGNVAALGREVEELKKNPGTGGGEGGGASLPEAGPYQYLVTDGNGQWGTADRLAYRDKPVTANVELAVSEFTTYNGKYWYKERASVSSGGTEQYDKLAPVGVKSGTEITIDGVVYEADEVHTGNDSNAQYYCTYIGNGSLFDSAFEDTGERYCLITGQNLVMGDDMKALYISGDFSTAAITNYGEENVKLIDPAKWLPEGYPYEKTEEVKTYHRGLDHLTFSGTSYEVFDDAAQFYDHVKYKVELDGEVYDVTGEYDPDQNPEYGFSYIGDSKLVEYPFYIHFDGYEYKYTIQVSTSGDHTLSVYTGKSNTTVQPLDPKFLPETIAMKSELPIVACFKSVLQYDPDTGGNNRLVTCNIDYTTVYTGLDDDNFVCYVVEDSTRYIASKVNRNRDYVDVYYENGIVRYNEDGTLTVVEN